MRLLFIIHAITGGGAERVMTTVMNHLCRRGYEVFLLTNTDIPFAYEIDDRIGLNNLNIPCPPSILGFRRRIWRYIVIRQTAKERKCDVAISFLAEMNCTTIISLLCTGIPLICSEHSNILRRYPKRLLWKRTILYHFADVITVLTRHDYKLWRTKYRNCVRMPNPSDWVEQSFNSERSRTVLAVGRVKQWEIKGFDTLIRAWSLICHRFNDWRLQIAGDYDEESLESLRHVIEESHAINVDFLGFRRDIGQLMNQSSVFCLSSRVEGLPMALIEAMNRGCCCVAFDVKTGPNEIIRNEVNGLLIKNYDTTSLAEGLELVLSDKILRRSLSAKAPISVRQYESNRVIDRWEILLSKVVC